MGNLYKFKEGVWCRGSYHSRYSYINAVADPESFMILKYTLEAGLFADDAIKLASNPA